MGEAKRRRAEIEQLKQHGKPAAFGEYLLIPDYLKPSCFGLFKELVQELLQLQPWRPDEFGKHAAAIHEASHCVVAARESHAPKSARIFQGPLGWLGDFYLDREGGFMSAEAPEFLSELRIILAGRRGELLCFGDKFCLRAGLDELTWALLMIVPMLTVQAGGDKDRTFELYGPTWDTTLVEVDETLMAHRSVVDAIANRLMADGSVAGAELAALVAAVPARLEQPRIRTEHEMPARMAFDPLAYPPSDPRRSQYRQMRTTLHSEVSA